MVAGLLYSLWVSEAVELLPRRLVAFPYYVYEIVYSDIVGLQRTDVGVIKQ